MSGESHDKKRPRADENLAVQNKKLKTSLPLLFPIGAPQTTSFQSLYFYELVGRVHKMEYQYISTLFHQSVAPNAPNRTSHHNAASTKVAPVAGNNVNVEQAKQKVEPRENRKYIRMAAFPSTPSQDTTTRPKM